MSEPIVSSLAKALRVLECFTVSEPELGVTEISKKLGIGKSNAHNIISTYCQMGYLQQLPNRKYTLGYKLLEHAFIINQHLGYPHAVYDLLLEAAERTGQVVYFGIPYETDVLYLYVAHPIARMKELPYREICGEHAPLCTTGIGKDYADAVKSGEMSAVRSVDIPAYSASGLIQYTVVYDWGTDVPSDQVLPTNNSKYTWEADARAAVDGTYTKGMAVSGSKNGKVGTWTFSGWDAGALDADTGVITFRATWTFEAAAPSITVPYIVCKVGKAIKPVAMETVNLDAGGTWSVENLPAGLVIDPATGVISGTPSVQTLVTNLKVIYTAPDGTATHSGLQTVQVAGATHYLLTFETNGGTFIPNFAWEWVAEIPLSSFQEPTRAGYTFDGWFSDAELTTAITSVILDDDITVYAKWTPIDPITITFIPQNDTAAFTETIAKNSKVSAPSEPVKDGYIFRGWYTAPEGGMKVDLTSMTFDGDITLYAQWEPAPEPSVTVPAISGRVGAPLAPDRHSDR